MSHMKEISIQSSTGTPRCAAPGYGAILVRDRSVPVARLLPVDDLPAVNRFERWKPLKRFAAALARPVGGSPVEDLISADRDR